MPRGAAAEPVMVIRVLLWALYGTGAATETGAEVWTGAYIEADEATIIELEVVQVVVVLEVVAS